MTLETQRPLSPQETRRSPQETRRSPQEARRSPQEARRSPREPPGAKSSRQILKPLREKRRRDRMNQSLIRLRSLVLPAQDAAERRVEKAEVLEHTVHFLTGQSGGAPRGSRGPPEQLHLSFQDGFSACLHRAVHFLECGDRAPWLAPTLDAALSRRAAGPCAAALRLRKTPQSALRERTQTRTLAGSVITNNCKLQKGAARAPGRSAECGQSNKPSLGPQRLWRPWP